MRYLVLATDYDGTLAHDGKVEDEALAALKRLRESGRKVMLVTGRELDELIATFPQIELCDRVVAENGALLYTPATKEQKLLAPAPPASFVEELKKRGVHPIAVGRSIVATWEPHQEAVLGTIRDLGLELQVIFNKGAVMVLPSGVNKASGMITALAEMGLSRHNVAGVGDAENDHAFLAACECSVAVANALPALLERVDLVTRGKRGAGVTELIDRMVESDLADLESRLARHRILLGNRDDGEDIGIDPYGNALMVCGTSGSGKSTLTTGFLERLHDAGYQFAILDPEGDYTTLDFAVVQGSPQRATLVEEMLKLLHDPHQNVVINLLGVALEHRPAFVAELLPRLLELRLKTGRPHWLVLDEAHHLLPANRQSATPMPPSELKGVLYITVHPGSVARSALDAVDQVVAVGEGPAKTIAEFCKAAGAALPGGPAVERLASGDALLWQRGTGDAVLVHTAPPTVERKRHSRKYAEGNLGPERSFFFRGPEGKLNLKAHNLTMFLQLAEGLDDETWQFHLDRGDYSRWFREFVKDTELANDVTAIEQQKPSPLESRAAVRDAIARRYTLPSEAPSGSQN